MLLNFVWFLQGRGKGKAENFRVGREGRGEIDKQ